MSTYNRNDLLFSRSLASVLRQTVQDFDVHIVSDGMRGAELQELEDRLKDLGDRRVKHWPVVRQTYPEDIGQKWCVLGLNARNHAMDHARGKFIAPLDDDDEWTDDHLEVLLRTIDETGVDFVYGMSQYHWPDGHQQYAGVWPPGHFQFCDGAQVYRNGMGFRYDPRCIERGLPEDGDLWDRMVEAGVSFAFLERVVHHYYPAQR